MAYRSHRLLGLMLTAMLAGASSAEPASAYLYWSAPNLAGAPVHGEEPGIGLPMPGATPAELQAHLLWNMRSGLNVAALQCQFSPILQTVPNYNSILNQHAKELTAAYKTLGGYFKRTGGKTWQTQLDQYTTKTYNGFSTMHAQLSFCDTAASIGREALERPKGELWKTAQGRMREFRNSLIPIGDPGLAPRRLELVRILPPIDNPKCWDKKDRLKNKCAAMMSQVPAAAAS
jgi:hypothetical protein